MYIRPNIGYQDHDLLDVPVRLFDKAYWEIFHRDGTLLIEKCGKVIWGKNACYFLTFQSGMSLIGTLS